ncbi:MAG: DUF3800 domain-containing protein [Candidatus Coatesbacteria bacterium]|nr:DUF3800 domain-containing protein [Candidatus Coatesbacteria bacterium]
MHICYIDEAGCLGVPNTPIIQPVFVIIGLMSDVSSIGSITTGFINIKRKYYPGKFANCAHYLDSICIEIKGSDLRKYAISAKSRERKAAIGYLDSTIDLCQKYGIKMIGRMYIKSPTKTINAKSIYSFSIQDICVHFQRYLNMIEDYGIVIADSRNKPKNVNISHSVFTGKFKNNGDSYSRLHELPVFGHSDNHALIQICDTIVSAILYPIGIVSYCQSLKSNRHVKPRYFNIKQRYGKLLSSIQYRYYDHNKWTGGIVVSDNINKYSGSVLFK